MLSLLRHRSLSSASSLALLRCARAVSSSSITMSRPAVTEDHWVSSSSPSSTTATLSDASSNWRPHVLPADADCWVRDLADDLSAARAFVPPGATKTHKPRILVLYGSLRETSFSRFMAYECARLLDVLGADVRVYNPSGLPVRDPSIETTHPKVLELRELVLWSEGHVWVSPEMHGQITGAMKNQIDWIPLNTGSVRPTQGKTAVVLQVNGGSQSFNAVNTLRILARWMRMPCATNQSSVPMAWKEFENDRMKPSDYRHRVVDVMEEFYKFTLLMREHADFLVDRFSERREKAEKGRLLTQAEKEAEKDAAKIAKKTDDDTE